LGSLELLGAHAARHVDEALGIEPNLRALAELTGRDVQRRDISVQRHRADRRSERGPLVGLLLEGRRHEMRVEKTLIDQHIANVNHARFGQLLRERLQIFAR
jgi:hypothetical protein